MGLFSFLRGSRDPRGQLKVAAVLAPIVVLALSAIWWAPLLDRPDRPRGQSPVSTRSPERKPDVVTAPVAGCHPTETSDLPGDAGDSDLHEAPAGDSPAEAAEPEPGSMQKLEVEVHGDVRYRGSGLPAPGVLVSVGRIYVEGNEYGCFVRDGERWVPDPTRREPEPGVAAPRATGEALTDEQGRFRFTVKLAVHAGFKGVGFEATAAAEGYATAASSWIRVTEDGPVDRDIRLVLGPAASLKGRVVGSDGVGIAGAWVDITVQGGEGRQAGAREIGAERMTDDAGAFCFDDLPAGECDLLIRSAGCGSKRSSLWLAEGENDLGDIVLRRMAVVTGRIVHAKTGEPLEGVPVIWWTRSGEDGRFRITTGPGSFELSIVRPDVLEEVSMALVLEEGETRDLGDIAVDPGIVLRGRVVDPDGDPISGAYVRVGARETESRKEGRFVVYGLKPGPYLVRAEDEGRDPAVLEYEAVEGREDDILLTMGSPGGVVRGFLSGAAGGDWGRYVATLMSHSNDEYAWFCDRGYTTDVVCLDEGFLSARAEENGAFEIRGVPAGTYLLAVWAMTEDFYDEFMEMYEASIAKAKTAEELEEAMAQIEDFFEVYPKPLFVREGLVVADGQVVDLGALMLKGKGGLSVRVAEQSVGVEGVGVTIYPWAENAEAYGWCDGIYAETDPSGFATFSGVVEGDWLVVLDRDGVDLEESPLEWREGRRAVIQAGLVTKFSIELAPADKATLRGRISLGGLQGQCEINLRAQEGDDSFDLTTKVEPDEAGGEFAIYGIEPGIYTLRLRPRRVETEAGAVDALPAFETLDLSTPGEHRYEKDIALHRVSGRVLLADGISSPASEISVTMWREDDVFRLYKDTTRCRADGDFVFPYALEGRYRLIACLEGIGQAGVALEVTGDISDVEIPLLANYGDLLVRLQFPSGGELGYWRAHPDCWHATLDLSPAWLEYRKEECVECVESGDGRWLLRFSVPEGAGTANIYGCGVDLATQDFVVASGETTEIELVLRPIPVLFVTFSQEDLSSSAVDDADLSALGEAGEVLDPWPLSWVFGLEYDFVNKLTLAVEIDPGVAVVRVVVPGYEPVDVPVDQGASPQVIEKEVHLTKR